MKRFFGGHGCTVVCVWWCVRGALGKSLTEKMGLRHMFGRVKKKKTFLSYNLPGFQSNRNPLTLPL